MRIVFFGTPDFAVPSLKALLDSGDDVVAVVTQPDKVKGRGRLLSQPPVKGLALSNGIPVLQPRNIRTGSFLEELSLLKPGAIAVVAYGKIVPPAVLKLPPLGCVNVHASLLPAYRGAAPIQWAIINGERRTGITTMLMDEGLDTGDILLQNETEILDEDNGLTLGKRLSEVGASLLPGTLEGLKAGTVNPRPQTGEPSFAPPLKKDDGKIDWSLPARRIFDLIRGTYPWPGAYCYLKGSRLVILRAKALDHEKTGTPGRIEMIGSEGVLVSTGRGILAIMEVKPEGRNSMSAESFMHGRRLKEGAFFDA
ncbi:MAG: methionyl-tRNA formyltransferase [Thermodesulfovibrionales bacterium]